MKYKCEEVRSYIDAYLDDELSVMETLTIQGHLVFCAECKEIVKSEMALRTLIETDALGDRVPGHLREEIVRRIDQEPSPLPSHSRRLSTSRLRMFFLGLVVGAVALGLMVTRLTYVFQSSPGGISPELVEMVGKHIRYSPEEERLQLGASDISQVGPWLNERLDFPVKLPQLARPGERLKGARLSSVMDDRAAYILYERNGRRISLFVFRPHSDLSLPGSEKRVDEVQFFTTSFAGKSVLWWEDQERYYAAVGDDGAEDLIEFGLLCAGGRTF